MKIFCVIPAFNEEDNITKVINDVLPHVNEVVVVDDASTDNTYKLATEQDVVVLRHVVNRGQGASLQTGNDYAIREGADLIVHFDADGQFRAIEIKDMIEPIICGEAEVVLGSRFLGKESNMPWMKKTIIYPIATFISKAFFGIKLSDPQNGFRALSRNATQKIKIINDGSAHCSEILYKVFKNNFNTKEIPVTVVYNDFGQTILGGKGRGMGGIRIIKDLFLSFLLNK